MADSAAGGNHSSGAAAGATTMGRPAKLSDHDFEDFGEIMKLNDRLSLELSEGFDQADLNQYQLEPPRVVVVGLTSAGKSSLLERILGFRIFPVKATVCTRRPFRVHMRHEAEHSPERASFRFKKQADAAAAGPGGSGRDHVFSLPDDIDGVRHAIDRAQRSDAEEVQFNDAEIFAEIASTRKDTFAFTDLPGIFLVSEQKMGKDYAANRAENERLKQHTLEIARRYIAMRNTIVVVVISASDWMHSMNNDNLVGYLAEWLEEIRKDHEVPVYGVITKLDTQEQLSANSPLRKILTGTLPPDHVLHGLKVAKWIPVVSSPDVLALGSGVRAAKLERESVLRCLKGSIPGHLLQQLPIGRSALLVELKTALLRAISRTHVGLKQGINRLVGDIDRRLDSLPRPASAAEKRRLFDQRLKVLENTLSDLIGARGRYMEPEVFMPGQEGFGGSPARDPADAEESKSAAADDEAGAGGGRDGRGVSRRRTDGSSLRMRLMVELPSAFDHKLQTASGRRSDVLQEVSVVLNQAVLEQGGSFDSDLSFASLSQKIIQRYQRPCLELVRDCAAVVGEALCIAVHEAFSEYPELEQVVLGTLGLQDGQVLHIGSGGGGGGHDDESASSADQNTLFGFLTTSARAKVAGLLDALQTMACFHPMWRNFDTLYHKVLSVADQHVSPGFLDSKKATAVVEAANTIQNILGLPQLAELIRTEGEHAVRVFQKQAAKTGQGSLGLQHQERVKRHFARMEVMAYIVRLNLISSVFPIILRDLRDGLFRGVVFGNQRWEHGVCTALRMQLVFEEAAEQQVFHLMEPSPESLQLRQTLTRKRQTLLELRQAFAEAQQSLQRLMAVFASRD